MVVCKYSLFSGRFDANGANLVARGLGDRIEGGAEQDIGIDFGKMEIHKVGLLANLPAEYGQVGQGLDIVDALRVLGDAKGVEDRRRLAGGLHLSHLANGLGWNSTDLRGLFRTIVLEHLCQFGKNSVRSAMNLCLR